MTGNINCLQLILVVLLLQNTQEIYGEKAKADCEFNSPELVHFTAPFAVCFNAHPDRMLCLMQCFTEKIGFIDEKGIINKAMYDEVVNLIPPSNLKNAVVALKKDCLDKYESVDITKPDCAGFTRFALCLHRTIRRECPNFTQFIKDFLQHMRNDK